MRVWVALVDSSSYLIDFGVGLDIIELTLYGSSTKSP